MTEEVGWHEFLDLVKECIQAGAPKDKLINDMVHAVPLGERANVRAALETVFREMEREAMLR